MFHVGRDAPSWWLYRADYVPQTEPCIAVGKSQEERACCNFQQHNFTLECLIRVDAHGLSF